MKNIVNYVVLQSKLDLRNKNVLLPFYVIPLLFYFIMGFVFSSVIPGIEETLTSSMIVFGVVIGTCLGQTIPISDIYGSDIIKSYKLGHIPIHVPLIVNIITSIIHVTIVSIIIFVTCPILFDVSFPSQFGLFLIGYISMILASTGIGALIGTSFSSTSGLVMAGQIVFLPSVMLSGIMFPNDLLPEFLQGVAYIFPATLGSILMTATSFEVGYTLILLGIFAITLLLSFYQIHRVK